MEAVALDPEDGLTKFFIDCIKDIYWAENHLVKAIPKMINAASLPSLQNALKNHLEETKGHVERLNQVFDLLGTAPQAKKCDAIEGITKEGEGTIESTDPGTPARNLGIILSSQKVEHYEISSYTGLSALANKLGHAAVADKLLQTLAEETASDVKLSIIADEDIKAAGTEA
ncbi:MAG: ferritin-like domain-containing protein [Rhizobacter sp.]|nr:ferritin-like domain-containing protein [Ferruginibacter sp.]